MAEVILMPRLSDTMTEGVIAAWHKKVGDTVKKGDALLVLEAMKMENVIKAAGDGVVKKINVSEKTAVEKGAGLIEFE